MRKKLTGIVVLAMMLVVMVPSLVFADSTDCGITVSGTEGVDWEFGGEEGYYCLTILKNGVTISGTATDRLDICIADGVTNTTIKNFKKGENYVWLTSDDNYKADEFTLNVKGNNELTGVDIYEELDEQNTDGDWYLQADPFVIKGTDKATDNLTLHSSIFADDSGATIEKVSLEFIGEWEGYEEYYSAGIDSKGPLVIKDSIVALDYITTDDLVYDEETGESISGGYKDVTIINSELALGHFDTELQLIDGLSCDNVAITNSIVDIIGNLNAEGNIDISKNSECFFMYGIYSCGEVDITDSKVEANDGIWADGGYYDEELGEYFSDYKDITITNSDIVLEDASLGAEMYLSIEGKNITITDSNVSIEDSLWAHGAITIEGGAVEVNNVYSEAQIVIDSCSLEAAGQIIAEYYEYDEESGEDIFEQFDITIKDSTVTTKDYIFGKNIEFSGNSKVDIFATAEEFDDGMWANEGILATGKVSFNLTTEGAYVDSSVDENDFNAWAINAEKGIVLGENNIIKTGGEVVPITDDADDVYCYTIAGQDGNGAEHIKVVYKGDGSSIEPDEPMDEAFALRIYGGGRIETSIGAADQLLQALGGNKFENVVVATAYNFADALPGSYVAAEKSAPILLIDEDYAKTISKYINDNMDPDGTVYILGGEGVVPSEWLATVEVDDDQIVRLGGANRYGTNLEILKEIPVEESDTVMVCTGMNFADSLSASATGNPILLADDGLTTEQVAYLESIEGCDFCMIGGEGAVPKKIADAIAEYDGDGEVERAAGTTRFETSKLVAEMFISDKNPRSAVLAYGYNFPDGLSGGPIAYAIGAPLILTASDLATEYTPAKTYVADEGIESSIVLGGSALISDKTIKAILGADKKVEISEIFVPKAN